MESTNLKTPHCKNFPVILIKLRPVIHLKQVLMAKQNKKQTIDHPIIPMLKINFGIFVE